MELPLLEPIWQKYKDKGLSIIAVDVNQRGKYAKKFIDEKKLTYHFLETRVGTDDPVKKVFKVRGIPINFLINAEGKIMYLHSGFEEGDEKKLEAEVVKLLGL